MQRRPEELPTFLLSEKVTLFRYELVKINFNFHNFIYYLLSC